MATGDAFDDVGAVENVPQQARGGIIRLREHGPDQIVVVVCQRDLTDPFPEQKVVGDEQFDHRCCFERLVHAPDRSRTRCTVEDRHRDLRTALCGKLRRGVDPFRERVHPDGHTGVGVVGAHLDVQAGSGHIRREVGGLAEGCSARR